MKDVTLTPSQQKSINAIIGRWQRIRPDTDITHEVWQPKCTGITRLIVRYEITSMAGTQFERQTAYTIGKRGKIS